ncbi:MAG: chloride channel protein [Burkholderiaceae bacterium]|jgi:CIC family chloride channel protein
MPQESKAAPPDAQSKDWGLWIRLGAITSSMLLGMIVGAVALGIFAVVDFFNGLWMIPLPETLGLDGLIISPAIGISLLIAAIISGRVLLVLEGGRAQGPADLILAAQRDENPNVRAGLLSTLLATVNLSGGASIGIFGPMMHFGGYMSSVVMRWSHALSQKLPTDIILGSGAAAAIAAVFSAPIGAAILAHEAIIRRFGAFGAGPVIAAAFGAQWIAHVIVGDQRIFDIQSTPTLTAGTFFLAIGVGISSGLASIIYIRAVTASPSWAKWSGIPLQWRPLVPAAFLFMLSPLFPHLLGHGLGSVDMALAGKLSLTLLLALIGLKIIATSLCIGFGMFGGVFAPALFIGALSGAILDVSLPGIDPASSNFAILGAASCIAAVIGAPLAAVMIVFELTGSYEWAVLGMISVVTANQFSRALAGRSLFDRQLLMRGIQLKDDHLR